MTDNRESYELNPNEFKHALNILNREKKVYSLSKWKKIAFTLLNISILVFFAAVIGLIVMDSYAYFFKTICSASILLSVIMFLAYLPGAIRIWRQNNKIKKIGLKPTFRKAWKMARKKSRIRNAVAIFITIIGAIYLLLIIFFIAVIMHISTSWSEPSLILGILVMLLVCTPFASLHFLWKSRQRHDVISGLTSSLVRTGDIADDGPPAVTSIKQSDYHIIAELERSQILRDRAHSILSDGSQKDLTYYSIQKSASFRKSISGLDRKNQLAVDDFIEELSVKQITNNAGDKIENLKVDGTNISISVNIDDSAQQLKILSLNSNAGDD